MRSLSCPLLLHRLLLRCPKSAAFFSPSSSSSPSIRFLVRSPARDRSGRRFSGAFYAARRRIPPLRSDPSPPSAAGADMAVGVAEGSMAARFWMASRKEALLASYTPFVVLLAAGKLDLDVFRSYIAQDVYFLRAFAQA